MDNAATIYLVDDNVDVLKTLSTVFKTSGFQVFAYSSAADFLKVQSFHNNAAVLLDLRMPGMSGLELLRLLRERDFQTPIIIYSAHADVDATVQAFSDGVFTLIQKPLSNHLLIEKVREAIAASATNAPIKSAQKQALKRLQSLTKREMEIAKLLTQGMSAPAIGEKIHISHRTVETHRLNIFNKTEVKSSAELAKLITLMELNI